MLETEPEVGKLIDHLAIVAYGGAQVACLLKQQGPVEEGHEVVGLQSQHEVEVLDAPVVVAHLGAQQSTVVVAEEVVGVEVEGGVIVGHRAPQSVLVVACHRPVDIVGGILGLQVYGLGEHLLSLLPLLAGEVDDGLLCPDARIVGVEFEALVERLHGGGCVLLQEPYLGLHGIATRVACPMGEHGVDLGESALVVLLIDAAEDAVVPEGLVVGIVAKGYGIVADGIGILLLVDAAESTKLIDARDVGVALDGLRTVALGSPEVVEIELGHAPEVPGFVEVGLG